MARVQDLSNQSFGELTVIKRGATQGGKRRWWCKCKCGKEELIDQQELLNNSIIRCTTCQGRVGGRTIKSTFTI